MSSKYIKSSILLLALMIIVILNSCSKGITSSDTLTSSLYMQHKRIEAFLPTDKEEKALSTTINEVVKYQQKIDTIRPEKKKEENTDDEVKSFALQEVSVVADRPKIKISNIRNGMVTLKFMISVPKIFANKDWRVLLSPKLINGDKTHNMKPVVLFGENFAKEQESQYNKFAKFDSTFVDKSKYDSLFFDNKKHTKYMKDLESLYLNEYELEYKNLMDYIQWRKTMEERNAYFNIIYQAKYRQGLHNKALSLLSKKYKEDLFGDDTTNTSQKYKDVLDKLSDSIASKEKYNLIKENNVLPKFKRFYENNITPENIEFKTVSEKDSLNFAKHTYKEKDIVKNELIHNDKDRYFDNMVFLKKIDSAKMEIKLAPDSALTLLYTEDIPVTEDLSKKLFITMDTRVLAIDRSSWAQKGIDTLSFVVTGLNDLADDSLLEAYKYNEKYYNDYKAGLDRLKVRDYTGALTILRYYPDYNATIALFALGMNDKALELVNKIPQTGKSLYLKSMILVRLNQIDEAKNTLKEAVRKESFLGYKADAEPELAKLFEDEKFKTEIQEIADGLDF